MDDERQVLNEQTLTNFFNRIENVLRRAEGEQNSQPTPTTKVWSLLSHTVLIELLIVFF